MTYSMNFERFDRFSCSEAMNRILKIRPDINITSARKIVDTRNYVILAYDSLKPDILWAIVINHIPRLKRDILHIIESSQTIR